MDLVLEAEYALDESRGGVGRLLRSASGDQDFGYVVMIRPWHETYGGGMRMHNFGFEVREYNGCLPAP